MDAPAGFPRPPSLPPLHLAPKFRGTVPNAPLATRPHVSVFRLVLYVAGPTPRSESARATLRWIAEGGVRERVEHATWDVVDHPERAEAARILTTPMLVREEPLPVRRVVGDLGDVERVVEALGLTRADSPHRREGTA